MVKVQSQSGNSLADIYDVRGSIAGVEQLETHELPIVHEMGSTVFSERLSGRVLTTNSGAVAQNTAIDQPIIALLVQPFGRIGGIFVFIDTTSRLTHMCVCIEEEAGGAGMPIWVWDGTNEDAARVLIAGTPTNVITLRPNIAYTQVPNMLMGVSQPEQIPNLTLRGLTSGFGAGTVQVTLNVELLFPVTAQSGALSSRGLPVPSW